MNAIHRGKVWKWVVCTFHVLWVMCGIGWCGFCQSLDETKRNPDPFQWRSITISIDQGSDGWSAGQS